LEQFAVFCCKSTWTRGKNKNYCSLSSGFSSLNISCLKSEVKSHAQVNFFLPKRTVTRIAAAVKARVREVDVNAFRNMFHLLVFYSCETPARFQFTTAT
jgi:hypothetical protein